VIGEIGATEVPMIGKLVLSFTMIATAAVFAAQARAATILDTTTANPGATNETRPANSAILTRIVVGASNVTITGFGTFGRLSAAGNAKWLVYQNPAGGASPVFQTASTPVSASGTNVWYDSPTISFTLLANTTYFLGLQADQAFTYTWDVPGVAVSGGGLTAPTGQNGNSNGTLAAPTYAGAGGVLQSIRIQGGVPPVVTCTTAVTAMQPTGGGLVNVGLSYTCDDPAATKTVAVYSNDNNLTGTGTSFFFNGGFYYPKPAAAQLFGTNLLLRADRYATPGRVYLIVVKATNANGTGFASTTVVVPFAPYFLTPPSTITTPAATAKAFCDSHAGAPPDGSPGTVALPPAGTGYDTHLAPTSIP